VLLGRRREERSVVHHAKGKSIETKIAQAGAGYSSSVVLGLPRAVLAWARESADSQEEGPDLGGPALPFVFFF